MTDHNINDLDTKISDLTKRKEILESKIRLASVADFFYSLRSDLEPVDALLLVAFEFYMASLVAFRKFRTGGIHDQQALRDSAKHFEDEFNLSSTQLDYYSLNKSSFIEDFLPLLKSTPHPILSQYASIINASAIYEKISEKTYKNIRQIVSDMRLNTVDSRDNYLGLFDSLISQHVSRSLRLESQFNITPPSLVRIIGELSNLEAGAEIFDPWLNTGELLTGVKDRLFQPYYRDGFSASFKDNTINGYVLTEATFCVAATRFAMFGILKPNIRIQNPLAPAPDKHTNKTYDLIVSKPPFGIRINEGTFSPLQIPSKHGEGVFIQQAINQLKENGRAIFVLRTGFLFGSTRHEVALKKWLVENNYIESIINLPSKIFYATSISGCIVTLSMANTSKTIRMVDASDYFEETKKRQPLTINKANVKKLVDDCRSDEPLDNAYNVTAAELEDFNWDLSVKKHTDDALSKFSNLLSKKLPVKKLGDIVELITGQAVSSEDLLDQEAKENNPTALPLVRISDIDRGIIDHTGLYCVPRRPGANRKTLITDDVLFSRSGTIGKVALVRSENSGYIPSQNLFVLRIKDESVDARFLTAFLRSPSCNLWLENHSHGTAIKNINRDALSQLPIPIPDKETQLSIGEKYRSRGFDVIAYLLRSILEEEGSSSPLHEWIDKSLSDFSMSEHQSAGMLAIISLDGATLDLEKVELEDQYLDLIVWFLGLQRGLSFLTHINSLPEGESLYQLARFARQEIEASENKIKGDLPLHDSARKLTKLIINTLEKISHSIADKFDFELSLHGTDKDDKKLKLALAAKNNGLLTIHEVTISSKNSTRTIPLIKPGESSGIFLDLDIPDEKDNVDIHLNWECRDLENIKYDGETQFHVEISSNQPIGNELDLNLGGSPYISGTPLNPSNEDLFFGREDTIARITRDVINTGNVVLLEGNRRAGKTSILNHLKGQNIIPGWLSVYCSLQGASGSDEAVGVPTESIFRAIATDISIAVHALGIDTPLPNGAIQSKDKGSIGIGKACIEGITKENAFSDFKEFINAILMLLSSHDLKLLLMLDEFDKVQEGIDNGITSPQVPENIRYFIQTYPGFSAILTGSRRLKRLREEYWSALFGLGNQISVSSLSKSATEKVITTPVSGKVTYDSDAIERLSELTACQPYLVQSLCNYIFNYLAENKLNKVTYRIANTCANQFSFNFEHFASLWGYSKTDVNRYILAKLAKPSDESYYLTFELLSETLLQEGINLNKDQLGSSLDFLRELELIKFENIADEGRYSLEVPLMGMWIEHQKDIELLKNKAITETS